jgi:hypothetical protein
MKKTNTTPSGNGEHTPGEWELAIFEFPHGKEIVIKESKLKNKNGEWMFADRICTMGNYSTQNEANAKLIASAPQLKAENEALKEANKEILSALISVAAELKCYDWSKETYPVFENAKTIINKHSKQ